MVLQHYPQWLHPQDADVLIDVLVSPGGPRSRVMGVHDERLKIQIAAPPVDGKANEALVRFLAETLDVSKSQVAIVGGPSSKRKTVRIAGVQPNFVYLRLAPPRSP